MALTKHRFAPLRIRLLGAPLVELRGIPVALPRRRTRALLYYLAGSPGSHGRDELVELLWPNLTGSKGRRQLSDALSDLRRMLGGESVESDAERVGLSGADCDVPAFMDALGTLGTPIDDATAADLSDALDVYAGEFLSGIRTEGAEPFDAWVRERRSTLSILALGAYARVATFKLDAAEPGAAIQIAQRGLELDNLREDLWRIVIQAHGDMDDRAGALAAYGRCRETLQRELGAAPEAATEALRRRVSAERGTAGAGAAESQAAGTRPPLPFTLRLPGSSLALVARERELATLAGVWDLARAGGGGLVALEGEPGIGKTRLATEFAVRAASSGATVLAARCPELSEPPPYGPIEEAARAVLPSMPSGAFAQLGPAWLPWVGRLLPEIGLGVDAPPVLAPEEEKARLAEAAGRLLGLIAGDGPLLLIIEDLHWAHRATVQILHTIARRQRRLLVLTTMRDTEPQTEGTFAAARAVADLEREGLATRVHLGPLGANDTESLVKLAMDSVDGPARTIPATVARLAEGQPLFALELTRALLESPGDPVLPESLAKAIASRVSHASKFARQVLELVAVVGRPVTPQLLGRAVGVEPSAETLVSAGDELMMRRLLQEDESGALVASHGLIQAAVYNSLSVSRRRALHARTARAIESGADVPAGVRSELLARHYRLAGELSRSAEHLMSAGERADALGEVATAAARFRSASNLLREEGKDREAALALERSGNAVLRACNISTATAAFRDALEVWRRLEDNEEALMRLHVAMSQLVTRWGYLITTPDEVDRHVDAAVRLTEAVGGEKRSLALSARSFVRSYEGDLDRAEEDASKALTLAEDHYAAWQSATDALAAIRYFQQDWREGLNLTLARARRATQASDPFELFDIGMMASSACEMLDEMEDAESHARLAVDAADDTGDAHKVLAARTTLAEILVVRERWREADELVSALLEDPAGRTDRLNFVNMRRCLAAELAARRGDPAKAQSFLAGVPDMPHFNVAMFGRLQLAYERAQATVRDASRPRAEKSDLSQERV